MDKQKHEKRMMLEEGEKLPVKLPPETEENIRSISFLKKLNNFKSYITVEPVLAFFVMPSVISKFAAANLNLEKACKVDLNYGDVVCKALKDRNTVNYKIEEDAVQNLVASVDVWKSILHVSVPTILMLFIGAWSDKTGRRKMCMLIPIFGEFMTCILNLISTYYFHSIPVGWTAFMEVIMPALTGGWYTMFLATFSYLSDITSREKRTFRMGILNLCMTLGFPTGMWFSKLLLKRFNFYGAFLASAMFLAFNFIYVLLRLEDHTWLNEEKKSVQKGWSGVFIDFFDFRELKSTLAIVFTKGDKTRILRMCLILLGVCLTFGTLKGEHNVLYLFCLYRFKWTASQFSYFTIYNMFTHLFGVIFALTVFSKRLKMNDALLGMLSTISKIGGALIMAFARTSAAAYISPAAELLSGTAMIALRSIASKQVSYQEQGKVYSLFGMAETFGPLIFESSYSKLYQVTFYKFTGAVFLLTVALMILAFFIFGWFYLQDWKDSRQKRMDLSRITIPESSNSESA